MMHYSTVVKGSCLGLTAVVLGAFGAHALKEILSVEQLQSYETAVRYQFFHALLLLVIGFNSDKFKSKWFKVASLLTFIGVLLFSGSIYLLVIVSNVSFLGPVTPLGGTALITGWVTLILGLKRS